MELYSGLFPPQTYNIIEELAKLFCTHPPPQTPPETPSQTPTETPLYILYAY